MDTVGGEVAAHESLGKQTFGGPSTSCGPTIQNQLDGQPLFYLLKA